MRCKLRPTVRWTCFSLRASPIWPAGAQPPLNGPSCPLPPCRGQAGNIGRSPGPTPSLGWKSPSDVGKTGSLVVPFVNAYYTVTGTPVVGVSASQGGTSILQWQPGQPLWQDMANRWQSAGRYLERAAVPVRHRFLLWCQGETDGDRGMTGSEYGQRFGVFWVAAQALGLERCFLLQIGRYNGEKGCDYGPIQAAQEELCRTLPGVELVSRDFETMQARGLMRDDVHYFQAAYNEVGTLAGVRAGRMVNRLR